MPNTVAANPVPPPPIHSHHVRTFFASIAGTIAVYLIIASVSIIWLNQTITNTSVYVNTVAPLVEKPAIQNFIAQKVATEIVDNAPLQNLAATLLTYSQLNPNQTAAQVKSQLTTIIESDVLAIVRSSSFAALWRNTNQTAHAQLISQLNSGSNQLQLDLSPAINGVINELKSSQLSPIASQISINPNSGKLDIKNSGVAKAHRYYKLFQEGTIAVVAAAILAIILAVWLSVHHAKTARRILIGTGILSLLQALVLEAPALIKFKGTDTISQNAAKVFVVAIVHNLLIASLIIGIICIMVAIGSKIYSHLRRKNVLKTA
jgi:hypothetical protein